MEAVKAAAEIHRACAERIGRAACHEARQVGATPQHLGRWRPGRPFRLPGDRFHATPFEARPPDADAVANRSAVPEDEVETPLGRVDDDGAGSLATAIANELAGDGGHARRPAHAGLAAARDASAVEDHVIDVVGLGDPGQQCSGRKPAGEYGDSREYATHW